MKIIIYVLCFNDASESKARRDFGSYSWARPLRIETTLWLEGIMYESWLMAREAEWAACDYVGTIAYSIFSKIPLFSLNALHAKINQSDIFAFYKSSENLLAAANCTHFRELWVDMLARLGFTEAEAVDPSVEPFYCNYWIARPAIMREYCDFYRRAQGALAASALQAELWGDSGYASAKYSNADWCRRVFGVPHYPLHVFLMERLPCFFAHKRYRVETIDNKSKMHRQKIVYLVWFDAQSDIDCRNKSAIAAYASMFPNIRLLFIGAGTQSVFAGDTLTVRASCAIDVLLGAFAALQKIKFDYVICSDTKVALDFQAIPDAGGVHYSGPVFNGPYIWGRCLTLSREAVQILMTVPVDKTLSLDEAIGAVLRQMVQPIQKGSVCLNCTVPTGAYCYIPPTDTDLLDHLVAQFERPAVCVPDTFGDDSKLVATKIIQNLFASALASKGDLSAAYSGAEELDRLGLPLHCGSRWSAEPPVAPTEDKVLAWLRGAEPLPAAVNLRGCEPRSRESRDWLRAHVRARAEDVRAANPFRARYGNNNDVFIYANDCACELIKELLDLQITGFLWKECSTAATNLLAEFPSLVEYNEPDPIRMLQFASTCGVVIVGDSALSVLLEALAIESKVWQLAPGA